MSTPLFETEAPCVLVTGGGTGGHIIPALALCEEIRRRNARGPVCIVGRAGAMEERLAAESGVAFVSLASAPLRRSIFHKLVTAATMSLGLVQGWRLITKTRPAAIAGFGGYASFPLLAAGLLRGVPVVAHEANALPGRAVRLLVRLGAHLAYGIDTGHPRLVALRARRTRLPRARNTGNPVRHAFVSATAADGARVTGLAPGAPTVMVVGGSQGSRRINSFVLDAVPAVKAAIQGVQFIHLTGAADRERAAAAYARLGVPAHVSAFSSEMGALYRLASVVVARAGALSIAEICAAGVAAILIPYPHATERHQDENARFLGDAGGAVVLDEGMLDAETFTRQLIAVLRDDSRRARMAEVNRGLARADAAAALCDFLDECFQHAHEH